MVSAYESDPIFETVPRQLSNLVTRIRSGEIALPDFQRDFVWDAARTEELIRSIISKFPVGTLLFWKQGGVERIASRNFGGAPPLQGNIPAELVLDGQQRLTALYQALTGTGDEHFYLKIDAFVDIQENEVLEFHKVDFDTAIISVPAPNSSTRKQKRSTVQLESSHFHIADVDAFDDWLDEYVESQREEPGFVSHKYLKSLYRRMRDKYIVPLRSYGLPVLTLPDSTPMEAVCTIFETLNRTGKPLGPFELLTAKYFPHHVNLREYWIDAQERCPNLSDFKIDPYNILQAVCVRVHGSAQRADVLNKLTADDIRGHWDEVVSGIQHVIDMLQSDCGLISPRLLPYGTLIIPMAAVWPEIEKLDAFDQAEARERLQQFFWCSVFTTNYDQGANSQIGADYSLLKSWVISGVGDAPEAVDKLPLMAETLRSAGIRRKALHAGVMCLLVQSRAEDFHKGNPLTQFRISATEVESHHIFPKAYLAKVGSKESSELILNRTLIDGKTNRIISNKAPSVYLGEISENLGRDRMESILESHAIHAGTDSGIFNDDYEKFLDERLAILLELVAKVTKRDIARPVPSA
ncbi:GmrSD restriction endonuclease domain-containing protein [Glycomyces terrestris]|uniref:DUF262 domain-containing protein n=1 Tax=Glycomyces terrestris TaxID=2493553 RepID=A0A426V5G3_9ACTN|nr:DUF262 domain-containing protein [Glycomyces terrestris]RRS02112.1 DUF262 domain-containing protein [Glycomyces terrestris]